MIRRWIFLIVLLLLGLVLFYDPNFKTIAAGVSILLFGVVTLESGFKVFTKGPLKRLLKMATGKLYKSISTGAIVTAIIQSSSLVSVITISFISAGLVTLYGGIGLIYGANIGTTFTAWLVAGFGLKVNISVLAMPMLIFGILFSFQKGKSLKGMGNVLTGLGFFFLGIFYMKEGFEFFNEYFDLTRFSIEGWLGVLVYTGVGILLTTILQSSSASLALILTALSVNQITYENALALAIGTNIGTTVTALIGSVGSNIAGKRLAFAHLIFNLVTGVVAIALIYPLARLVNFLSEVSGIASDEYTLKLAIFHTLFNVLGVIIMIPFIKSLERLLKKYIKESRVKEIDDPKFLNQAVLEFPGTLVTSVEKETKYLFENAIFEIVAHALNMHRSDLISDQKIKSVVKRSKKEMDVDIRDLYIRKVKTIYGKMLEYMTKAQSELNPEKEAVKRISEIKIVNRKMVEIIRDVKELRINVIRYTESDNIYMKREYQGFRRMIAKVLRALQSIKDVQNPTHNKRVLDELERFFKEKLERTNKRIDKLIRKNLINVNMASSLVNDHANVNDMIEKLIEVCELLYVESDSILEATESETSDHVQHNTGSAP
jgi:phosphate:Na+ symporter